LIIIQQANKSRLSCGQFVFSKNDLNLFQIERSKKITFPEFKLYSCREKNPNLTFIPEDVVKGILRKTVVKLCKYN